MKEFFAITSLFSIVVLFGVAAPSIYILHGKVSYLQREAVKSGAAQWVPNEDDSKILVLKFKEQQK